MDSYEINACKKRPHNNKGGKGIALGDRAGVRENPKACKEVVSSPPSNRQKRGVNLVKKAGRGSPWE